MSLPGASRGARIASRIARLPLNFPVGGAPQAGKFSDSQRRIARGNDLKGDSNATVRALLSHASETGTCCHQQTVPHKQKHIVRKLVFLTITLQMRQTARSAQKLRRIPVNQPGLLSDLFTLQNSGAGCRLTSLRRIVSCRHLHPWCDEISSCATVLCTRFFDSGQTQSPGVCGYG